MKNPTEIPEEPTLSSMSPANTLPRETTGWARPAKVKDTLSGGRCLDTLPATISVLPQVVERVAGRVPVLVDGGVRRGTDVLKAVALGAKAVLIGRPYLYGLAAGGAAGVSKVVEVLRKEFTMAMALTGRKSLAEIDRSVVW